MTTGRYRPHDRLKRAEDIKATFDEGQWGSTPTLRLVLRHNNLPQSRFAVAVSKQFGNAVARNLIKRRMREVIRLAKAQLPGGFDAVILPSKHCPCPSFNQLREALPRLITQTLQRLHRRPRSNHGR